MKFETIGPDGKVKMWTEHESCIPDSTMLDSMAKAGYKFRLDGKIVQKSAINAPAPKPEVGEFLAIWKRYPNGNPKEEIQRQSKGFNTLDIARQFLLKKKSDTRSLYWAGAEILHKDELVETIV